MSAPSSKAPLPRLYCILATRAPIALVFRRGPSDWFHLLRWHLNSGEVEPGVWARNTLYPRRCDLSEDGDLLLFYMSGSFDGEYQIMGGVSRTPWLHPLASWYERNTWGKGSCFVTDTKLGVWDEPRQVEHATGHFTLQANDAIAFLNERRRGWSEAPDCPPREHDDVWDQKRIVILQKPSPTRDCMLRLIGGRLQFDGTGMEGFAPRFELVFSSGLRKSLASVAWSDWDSHGRLLTATNGSLRIEELRGEELVELESHDLSNLTPNPQPAPDWALSA